MRVDVNDVKLPGYELVCDVDVFAHAILDCILVVLLGDVLNHKESVVVAAQGHGIQDDYLSMKMFTKFTEAPARSWPKPN